MSGSLAQTIQGEAGNDPAAQFAVASTIWNRSKAGSFPGGSDPNAIVNAPQQYVGYAATPSASAQAMADAITNGTLPNLGNPGNATYFQSYQPGFTPATAGGTNIGGNYFSDTFGNPSANFVPPSYGMNQIAQGPPDQSSGIAAGAMAGAAGMGGPLGTIAGVVTGGGKQEKGSTGTPLNIGIQKGLFADIQGWIDQIAKSVWKGVSDPVSAFFSNVQNWFVRAFVIIVGLVVLAVGIIKLSGNDVSDALVKVAKMMPQAA